MKKSKSALHREIMASHQYKSFRRSLRGDRRTKKQQREAYLLDLMKKINQGP